MLIAYFDEVKPSGTDQPYYMLGGLVLDETIIPELEQEIKIEEYEETSKKDNNLSVKIDSAKEKEMKTLDLEGQRDQKGKLVEKNPKTKIDPINACSASILQGNCFWGFWTILRGGEAIILIYLFNTI